MASGIWNRWRGSGEDLARQTTERADVVKDVRGAAVSAEDQVVLARLHDEVADADGWHAVRPREPVTPPVGRYVETELRPEEEEARVHRVLSDRERVAPDVIFPGQTRPVLAEVARAIDVGRPVGASMIVEHDERRRGVERRGRDVRDPRVRRDPRHVGLDARPRRATIPRDVEPSVIRSHPDERPAPPGWARSR